ncbi:hypothetical protein D9757_003991 [Collybiopsis confluens]|uniref:Uncharacterized protein n=1 Tax=Collybiopsis confluens TaxID=2823264 RepID=A0A8H5HX30_9AGAR|nr:hypothetical protein D9757_003991 [Collybiopsis confluens]
MFNNQKLYLLVLVTLVVSSQVQAAAIGRFANKQSLSARKHNSTPSPPPQTDPDSHPPATADPPPSTTDKLKSHLDVATSATDLAGKVVDTAHNIQGNGAAPAAAPRSYLDSERVESRERAAHERYRRKFSLKSDLFKSEHKAKPAEIPGEPPKKSTLKKAGKGGLVALEVAGIGATAATLFTGAGAGGDAAAAGRERRSLALDSEMLELRAEPLDEMFERRETNDMGLD